MPETVDPPAEPQRSFPDLFADFEGAVGIVEAVTCDTARQGTAFLAHDDVVITTASIVQDATEVAVTFGDESAEALVIGVDLESGFAALEVSSPIPELPLALSEEPVRAGEQVGALTQPVGLPQTMIVGRVSSIDEMGQIRTDAAVGVGSGGGPLIDGQGRVVGVLAMLDASVVDEGPLRAFSTLDIGGLFSEWVDAREPIPQSSCVGNVDLDDIDAVAAELISADTAHRELASVQRTFAVFTQSINSSRAEEAFGVLGPAITRDNTPEAWAQGQRTSKLWDWRIRSIAERDGVLVVRSLFTSTQEAAFGFDGVSTCTRWDITYELVDGLFRDEPYWLINRSSATSARSPIDCDDWEPEVIGRGQMDLGDLGTEDVDDRLIVGTVAQWEVGVGLVSANDPDEQIVQTPINLEVTVEAQDGFVPVIEIFDPDGRLVASNEVVLDGLTDSTADFTTDRNTVFDVRIRDAENRNGGEYRVLFAVSPRS